MGGQGGEGEDFGGGQAASVRGNLLVQGDNLEALKSQIRRGGALLPYYGGKVKVVFEAIRQLMAPPKAKLRRMGFMATRSGDD